MMEWLDFKLLFLQLSNSWYQFCKLLCPFRLCHPFVHTLYIIVYCLGQRALKSCGSSPSSNQDLALSSKTGKPCRIKELDRASWMACNMSWGSVRSLVKRILSEIAALAQALGVKRFEKTSLKTNITYHHYFIFPVLAARSSHSIPTVSDSFGLSADLVQVSGHWNN